MSDSKNVSRKLILALIKKYGPLTIGALVKKYKKLKPDTAFSDVRAAVSSLATDDDAPKLTIVQFQSPGDEKFNWMIFQAGTEFVFPEEPSAQDPDLDALSGGEEPPVPDLPLATDLMSGYFVVVDTAESSSISFSQDPVSACASALTAIGRVGGEAVNVYGAVPVRLDVAAFLDRNGSLTPLVGGADVAAAVVTASAMGNQGSSQAEPAAELQI